MEFFFCKNGITGESTSDYILFTLQKHGLNISLLRDQACDGTGMAGCVEGVAARIKSQYPLALYIHCFLRRLSLATVGACQVVAVRNAKVCLVF